MLNDMMNSDVDYYNSFCKRNSWVQHIMDAFSNDGFKNHNQWNAF